jgi:hypothetical protein
MGLRLRRRDFYRFTCLFASAILLGTFQNCSFLRFDSSAGNSQSGGTGIDGKVYASYGLCSSQVAIESTIVLDGESKNARLTRQNCQDLAQPLPVVIDSLQFATDSKAVFQFNGRNFDYQAPVSEQTVTIAFCRSAGAGSSVQALVWEISGKPNVRFGRISKDDGTDSGVLMVEAAATSPTDLRSVAGQFSSFTLNQANRTLSYSIGGAATTSMTGMNCGSQSEPAPVVVKPTGLAPPSGYTPSLLYFEDRFLASTLDSSKWIPQVADQNGIWRQSVPAPYSASNAGGFNAEFFDPAHAVTGAGLDLVATKGSPFAGYTWRSACVSTHGLFAFQSGYAQFRAKMPNSVSGMWAAIWFLEGGAEIDLQGSGYLGANPNRMLASNLHSSGNTQTLLDTGVDLSSDFHIYGMEYKPGVYIKMYLDGILQAVYTQNVPTGAMSLLMSLQVAQSAGSFHTLTSQATPDPSVFSVSDVQVYHLPP